MKLAREEGLPPYLILTNKQVLALIQKKPTSLTALSQIDGIGKGKIERYGKDLLGLLNTPAKPKEAEATA